VRVLAIEAPLRLHVAPLEAVDGTPVIDIKPVLAGARDS
jgi:tRNA (Thr-GGU) A37 N-methylase